MKRIYRGKNPNKQRRHQEDREYGFKQSHGGRDSFPGGEWGNSSDFGRFRESDSSDDESERPYDMDNFRSGRSSFKLEKDFGHDRMDSDFEGEREFNRSRFAEPYTGGQFLRSQYGTGSHGSRDWSNKASSEYGRFSGIGPKGYKRSDDRIREEVCETLYRSPRVDASDIEVTVKEGCVSLKGTVDNRDAKREAESCIENLPGVEDVFNELRVIKAAGQNSLDKTGMSLESESQSNRQSH
jgi:hypothetical protein